MPPRGYTSRWLAVAWQAAIFILVYTVHASDAAVSELPATSQTLLPVDQIQRAKHVEPAAHFPVFKGLPELGRRNGHPVDTTGLVHSHDSQHVHADGAVTTFAYNATLHENCVSLDAMHGLLSIDGCGDNGTSSSSFESAVVFVTLRFTAKGAKAAIARLRPGAVLVGSAHWHCGGSRKQVSHVIQSGSDLVPVPALDGTFAVRVATKEGHIGMCFNHLQLRFRHEPAPSTANHATLEDDYGNYGRGASASLSSTTDTRRLLYGVKWGGKIRKSRDLFNINYDRNSRKAKRELTLGRLPWIACTDCYFYISAGFSIELDVYNTDVTLFEVKMFGEAKARLKAHLANPRPSPTDDWASSPPSKFDLARLNLFKLGFSFASIHLGVDIDGSVQLKAKASTEDLLKGRMDCDVQAEARVEIGQRFTKSRGIETINDATWRFNKEYTNTLELGTAEAWVKLRVELSLSTFPLDFKVTQAFEPYVRARVAFGQNRQGWATAYPCTGWYDPAVNIRYGMKGDTSWTDLRTWKRSVSYFFSNIPLLEIAGQSEEQTLVTERDLVDTFCLSKLLPSIFNQEVPITVVKLLQGLTPDETQKKLIKEAIAAVLGQVSNRVGVIWNPGTRRRMLDSSETGLQITFAPSYASAKTPEQLSDQLVTEINNPMSEMYNSAVGGLIQNQQSDADTSGMKAIISIVNPDNPESRFYLCASASPTTIRQSVILSNTECGDWTLDFYKRHVQFKFISTRKCLDAYFVSGATVYDCETMEGDSDDQHWVVSNEGQIVSRNQETRGKCLGHETGNPSEGAQVKVVSCTTNWDQQWHIQASTRLFQNKVAECRVRGMVLTPFINWHLLTLQFK
jgi:hypothetical protein